ncbi:efflux RND transporter periplasmic adaptor subunit [Edaphobacter acidisoli]|uniref:efflux RND transporter periplasmic adaptor subunit n=1 Tax=Edaphobacter acidisoli TaxID=2040573 RepID=UPI001E378E51|nr:efflux RND transporter periplasmic adaptor subunit [Edaphobacter acidisoli]
MQTKVSKGLLALPLFLVAGLGCNHSDASAKDAAATLPIAPVVTVTRAPLNNTLEVAGEFIPYQEVELHAKVAGYIRHISVDIGDRVKAGQVLATLDVPELSAQVAGANAGVAQTRDQIARAKSDILSAQANHDALHAAARRLQQASAARPGLIAQQELDDANAKDRAAEAELDAAKSTLAAVEQQLGVSQADQQRYSALEDYSHITAPFTGVVTWRYADTGALIQAGTSNENSMPVVKLAEVDVLRLRLPVPASLASSVKIGDTATVHVQSLGLTFPGKVTRTTDALDLATRTLQVEIDVPNKDGRLQPGMYADVKLNINRTGDSMVLPVQAVDMSGGSPYVMLVDRDNRVEKHPVEVGVATANRTEILSGLNAGDRVIATNLSGYQTGETIEPKVSSMIGAGSRVEGK